MTSRLKDEFHSILCQDLEFENRNTDIISVDSVSGYLVKGLYTIE
jgi:hypothetical protein